MAGEAGILGAGSFGVVLCGYNESLSWVAVKCIAVEGGTLDKERIIQE